MALGAKLIKTVSDVPDQARIGKFEANQNYLRNLSYRIDRSHRADPLIRHTVLAKKRFNGLETSNYGRMSNTNESVLNGVSLMDDHSSSVLFSMGQTLENRPFSTAAGPQMNIMINNTGSITEDNTARRTQQ